MRIIAYCPGFEYYSILTPNCVAYAIHDDFKYSIVQPLPIALGRQHAYPLDPGGELTALGLEQLDMPIQALGQRFGPDSPAKVTLLAQLSAYATPLCSVPSVTMPLRSTPSPTSVWATSGRMPVSTTRAPSSFTACAARTSAFAT